jgi:rhodanese-related sulfurtransferase
MSDRRYIHVQNLASLISKKTKGVFIIDVRDDDYFDGNIRGAYHFPHCSLVQNFPLLLKLLVKETHCSSSQELLSRPEVIDAIIFHCKFSQTRGPNAMMMFNQAYPELKEKTYILKGGWIQWKDRYFDNSELTVKHSTAP